MEREQAISGKLASAQNVYRIMRERANAARGIVPKKSHDGYLVLSSRQWIERYPAVVSGKKMQCSTAVWKSVLETPYDVALVADQIGKQIENDLRTIVNDIGCHCMVSDKDNGRYKISMEKSKTAEKRIYCINGILWQILEVVFGSLKFIQLKVLRFQNRADFNKSSGIHLRKTWIKGILCKNISIVCEQWRYFCKVL